MRKITFYAVLVIALTLPAILSAQSVSGNIKPKTCQFQTGIELRQTLPTELNNKTTVGFNLTKTSKVTLKIYDDENNVVITLLDCELSAGYHSVQYYIPSISEGKYYYNITAEAGSRKTEKRMLVLL